MKYIIALLTINLLTSTVQASNLLELKMEGATETGVQRIRVAVDASGRVSKNSCLIDRDCGGEKDCKACESKEIGFLTRSEVYNLKNTIQLIEQEEVVPLEKPDHCFMLPIGYFKYSANNGTVLLAEGVKPCGQCLKNKSPLTTELKEFLLYVKMNDRLPENIVKNDREGI